MANLRPPPMSGRRPPTRGSRFSSTLQPRPTSSDVPTPAAEPTAQRTRPLSLLGAARNVEPLSPLPSCAASSEASPREAASPHGRDVPLPFSPNGRDAPRPRSAKEERDQPRPAAVRDQPHPRTGGKSQWAASGGRHDTSWPVRAEEPFGVQDGVTNSEDVRLFALVQDTVPSHMCEQYDQQDGHGHGHGHGYGYGDRTVRLPLLYMLVPPPSAAAQQHAHEAAEEGVLVAALRMAEAREHKPGRLHLEWEMPHLEWEQPVCSTQTGAPLLAADRERWLGGSTSRPISWREAVLHARGALGESLLHLTLRRCAEWQYSLEHRLEYRRLALLLLSPTEGPLDAAGVAQLAMQQHEGQHEGSPLRGLASLHLAVLTDDPTLVRAVLHAGVTAAGGASLLSHASGAFFYRSPEVYFGGSPIGLAACSGCTASLAELLTHPEARAALRATDAGPPPPPPPPRPLQPRSGHAAGAEAGAEAGARPLGFSLGFCTAGNTALHCAVLRGRAGLVAPLVAAGASPRQRNAWGQSALSLAAEQGDPLVFAAVLRATATQRWGFGGSKRVHYPLLEIDTLLIPQNEACNPTTARL